MPSARYDVLGIGNAIVDVIARTEEDFLLKQGMRKGTMALIDEARAEAIYDAMGPGGGNVRRLGGQHHRGSCLARRARRIHRQGQGRRTWAAPLPTISAPPA